MNGNARSVALGAADLDRLRDEARVLYQRLHRLLVALALVEDALTIGYDELADAGRPGDSRRRVAEVQRAKRAAEQLREFRRAIEGDRPT